MAEAIRRYNDKPIDQEASTRLARLIRQREQADAQA